MAHDTAIDYSGNFLLFFFCLYLKYNGASLYMDVNCLLPCCINKYVAAVRQELRLYCPYKVLCVYVFLFTNVNE